MVWTTVWVMVWGKAVMVTVEGEPVPKTVVVTKESCKFPVLFRLVSGFVGRTLLFRDDVSYPGSAPAAPFWVTVTVSVTVPAAIVPLTPAPLPAVTVSLTVSVTIKTDPCELTPAPLPAVTVSLTVSVTIKTDPCSCPPAFPFRSLCPLCLCLVFASFRPAIPSLSYAAA